MPAWSRTRDYARGASAEKTRTAYLSDWKDYAAWCGRRGIQAAPPSPEAIGLSITDLATGGGGRSTSAGCSRSSCCPWPRSPRFALVSNDDFTLVLPEVSTSATRVDAFAETLADDVHAVVVLDGAGWH